MEAKSSRQINNTINFVKAIGCIGVILIHCGFPGYIGILFATLARFAVPFFTAISGFYLLNRNIQYIGTTHLLHKIIHILKIIASAELFALCFSIISGFVMNHDIATSFARYTDTAGLLKLLWDNTPLTYVHYWYLYAMLYCYITVLILCKVASECIVEKNRKKISLCALFLFIAFYLMNIISNSKLPFDFLISIGRDDNLSAIYNLFIFRSLPFFLTGVSLKFYERQISAARILSKRRLVFIMFIGAILSCLERSLWGDMQIYIGTYLIVLAAFIFCIKYPNGINKKIEWIGKELSMIVYIIHISVMEVVIWIGTSFSLNNIPLYHWSRPIVVIGISLLCASVFFSLNCHLRKIIAKT